MLPRWPGARQKETVLSRAVYARVGAENVVDIAAQFSQDSIVAKQAKRKG